VIKLALKNSNCKYYIQERCFTIIDGKDSIKHLNRIVTSDITSIKDFESVESLICEANGKIIDGLEINKISGQILVISSPGRNEDVRKVFSSGIHWNEDVKIMNADNALDEISIFSEGEKDIEQILDIKIENQNGKQWKENENYYFQSLQMKKDCQVNILIPSNEVRNFTSMIEKRGVLLSNKEIWDSHRIENGILSNVEFTSKFLPSEIGLDNIVDLKKGCYPGQEIHARLESRGQTTKKIVRYYSKETLKLGDYRSDSGRKVKITSSSRKKGFAILNNKEPGKISLDGVGKITIEGL
jgi:folate-binding protein YgfZ|tara:strand:+ start:456 stop:1352 length:897 start_codon:yes stop_codon:yes gene_type:complete